MTEQEQVDGLLSIQGYGHELEHELHEARIVRIRPFEKTRASIARSYEIVLDSGRFCIFKPGNALVDAAEDGLYHGRQALKTYGHTPLSTVLSECAAWQLAKQLGPPWSELVVPVVLKWHELPETGRVEVGAASLFRGGEAGRRGFYAAVPDQVSSAAFFDALIGQQDRNGGNIVWYELWNTIYLIDHSFSFALAGANRGASDLLGWRRTHGVAQLDEQELAAVDKLLLSPDLLTLRRFVAVERLEPLVARAERMRETGSMVWGL